MSLNQTSAPATEPITTAEAKTHLRIDTSDDDTYIDTLVAAARRWAETFTERAFVTQTWVWKLDAFPNNGDPFRVPYPPLSSVTSITYLDVDGDSQTLETSVHEVDIATQPGRIALKWDQVWPIVRSGNVIDVVTMTFVAGYGDASDVPDEIKHAIKIVTAHLYVNREPVVVGAPIANVPLSAEELLWSKRMVEFA